MKRREFLALGPVFPAATVSASLVLREEGKEAVELDVNVLRVQDGDTLVLRAPHLISQETAVRIEAFVETRYPNVKAIVLGDGLEIVGVIRGLTQK